MDSTVKLSTTTQSSLSTTTQAPLSTTKQNSLPTSSIASNIVDPDAFQAADRWFTDSAAMVVMDPYKPKALMRVNVTVSHDNDMNATADAIIDTSATLNFVNLHYLQLYGLTKHCKAVPKVTVRVANEQRISTDKIYCPSLFTVGTESFTGMEFRVLPHFKGSNFILGLPAMKLMNMVIQPSMNSFTIGMNVVNCKAEPRRVSCMVVDSDKMNKIIIKQSRNKKNPSELFLISLQFMEELDSVKSDFGEIF